MATAHRIDGYHPLREIVAGWIGKIDRARTAKDEFQTVGDECHDFFSASTEFMWSEKYRKKFINSQYGDVSPRFRLTIAKAFELVALFGPVLFHRNPIRQVNPRKPLELPPQMLGMIQDPAMLMYVQQLMQEQGMRELEDTLRAELLSRYLNYTPNELPGGGLQAHAQLAITEALVRGRGCLWTEPYVSEGTGRMIVGSFFDSVNNLLIDPDAESLDDAKVIYRRRVLPTWEWERKFKLPDGSLKDKGQMESARSQGERYGDDLQHLHRERGETNDLLVVWEVYSRMGIGARMTGVTTELKEALENTFGDNCYLAVSQGIPYPLNIPSEALTTEDDEALRARAEWPVPFWADDRWPVTVLDFYPKPGSVWPIPPLAPGLGELKFINVMVSHLCNRIWSSSRDFIAVLKAAGEDIKNKITSSGDQTIIEIEASLGRSINDVVQFLQQPQTNFDVWKILDAVMVLFDKRVGLTELAYAMAGGMRSATEASVKREQLNVRPDHMAAQVESWMTEAARKEGLCSRWFVTGETMVQQLGPLAGMLWDQLVLSRDVGIVVAEMEYRIEAGSARKPNRDRDTDNVQQAMGYLLPILDGHAVATTDTNPLNALIDRWGRIVEMDTRDMMMGPRMPPMPPVPEEGAPPQLAEGTTNGQEVVA